MTSPTLLTAHTHLTLDAVPTYAPVRCALDVMQFASRFGYPIVVKPRRAHSSVGVMLLRSEQELVHKFLPSVSTQPVDSELDLEVERFVAGQMYVEF